MSESGLTCKHLNGDFIHGMWVCGQCFQPLYERPTRYYNPPRIFGTKGNGPPQRLEWQAETAKDNNGTSMAKFVGWMVGYLRLRSLWTISKEQARQQCLEVLRDQGEPFGSQDACWAREDAKDLVREGICSYWDEAPSGRNA